MNRDRLDPVERIARLYAQWLNDHPFIYYGELGRWLTSRDRQHRDPAIKYGKHQGWIIELPPQGPRNLRVFVLAPPKQTN